MDEIDKDSLAQLMHLSKLKCSDEEVLLLEKNLKSILGYIKLLQEADTEGIIGRHNLLECKDNVLGVDEIKDTIKSEDLLKNSPDNVGSMIKVPSIIQFEE